MWRYYGVDWLIFLTLVIHLWAIGNHWRIAFLFGVGASMFGFVFGLMTSSIAMILMNIVFAGMHLRAYMKWSNQPASQ